MSSFANVSSRWSITRPLTLPGASGLKIVGRPRVEIANPFWQRLCRTLYADVRGILAVSAIVSALPYPWATSAMYPRASYPERPIDSSVFVARSNSCSRSTPPASSFDKSCGTTGPRYPRAVFIFSNRQAQCWISKRDASLYPTGAFLRGHGFGAPSRPRCDNLPVDLLERFHSRDRPESSGPHGRHDRLRTLRDLGPERRRTCDVDADRGEGGGAAREDRGHVRHVRSDSSGLPVCRHRRSGERGRNPPAAGRPSVHGPTRKRPRSLGPRHDRPVHAATPVRPARERRGFQRRVPTPCAVLWPGNNATGTYANNAVAATRTTADNLLAGTSAIYVPFDLRYATQAWATFNYTGQVADPQDRLRLEVAHAPAFTDWTNLSFGAGTTLPTTAPGVWATANVSLATYLGGEVRLRLNFTSDAAGNARGFFIRDFAAAARCVRPVPRVVPRDLPAGGPPGEVAPSARRHLHRAAGPLLLRPDRDVDPRHPGVRIRVRLLGAGHRLRRVARIRHAGVLLWSDCAGVRRRERGNPGGREEGRDPDGPGPNWRLPRDVSPLPARDPRHRLGVPVHVRRPVSSLMRREPDPMLELPYPDFRGGRPHDPRGLDAMPVVRGTADGPGGNGPARGPVLELQRVPPSSGRRQALPRRREQPRDRVRVAARSHEDRSTGAVHDLRRRGTHATRVRREGDSDCPGRRPRGGRDRPERPRPDRFEADPPDHAGTERRRDPIRRPRRDYRRVLAGRCDPLPPEGERHGLRQRGHGDRAHRTGSARRSGSRAAQRGI